MSGIPELTRLIRQTYFTCLCVAGAGLGGCATAPGLQFEQAHKHDPMKILVMQSPMKIQPARLQKVFAPDTKQKLTITAPPIAQGISHSRHYTLTMMNTDLAKHPRLIAVTPSTAAKPLFDRIQKTAYSSIPAQADAKQLQIATGADAILRFNISDYGLTPTSWRSGYITFEVVTTLAITAAIASIGTSVAKGTAGAYLAQETVEETAEGYAGFWALDVVCRPVRVEAELIQLNPVKTVWTDSDTGLADIRLSRLFRKIPLQERNMQLDQSSDYAVNELISELSDKLSGKTGLHVPAKLKWER